MYGDIQAEALGESGIAPEAAAPIEPPGPEVGERMPDHQESAAAEAPPAGDVADAVARPPSHVSSLMAEIARAMQAAADRERERIEASVGVEETGQVEKIHARAGAESAELRRQADEDVSLVDAWHEDQVRRLREEADRRIAERRGGLERSLVQHGSLIEAEIASVHQAVQDYRASLGTFFGRLAEERDPSVIARLAGTLPGPPDLDGVRADARSGAMTALERESAAEGRDSRDEGPPDGDDGARPEREPVPVMDPAAVGQGAEAFGPAAITEAAPVSAAPVAVLPWSSPPRSDAGSNAWPPEAPASHANVAVRLIRTFTGWSSPPGAPEDQ